MNLIAPIASLLGIEVEELLARLKKDAIAYAVIGVFAAIGGVFLLVALNAWLTTLMGSILAALVIGGGFLLLAAIVYVTIRILDAAAERRETERRHSSERTALVTTAAFTALPFLMKSDLMKKVGIPVGGALAAAYLLAKPGHHLADSAED